MDTNTPAADIRLFQLDDCEVWAGASLAECIAAARREYGDDQYPDAEEDGHELTAAEIERRTLFVDEDHKVSVGFKERLQSEIQAGGAFPRMFCCTEC